MGAATIVVSVVVAVSLVARGVDFHPFNIWIVLVGLFSGLLAARTGRAFLALVLLVLAAYPTIFGWYVYFYLPLVLLLMSGGVARLATRRSSEAEAQPR